MMNPSALSNVLSNVTTFRGLAGGSVQPYIPLNTQPSFQTPSPYPPEGPEFSPGYESLLGVEGWVDSCTQSVKDFLQTVGQGFSASVSHPNRVEPYYENIKDILEYYGRGEQGETGDDLEETIRGSLILFLEAEEKILYQDQGREEKDEAAIHLQERLQTLLRLATQPGSSVPASIQRTLQELVARCSDSDTTPHDSARETITHADKFDRSSGHSHLHPNRVLDDKFANDSNHVSHRTSEHKRQAGTQLDEMASVRRNEVMRTIILQSNLFMSYLLRSDVGDWLAQFPEEMRAVNQQLKNLYCLPYQRASMHMMVGMKNCYRFLQQIQTHQILVINSLRF